ncbi:MAG: hypothetical protein U0R26_07725 [Solirubrobacterales bacterium]
MAGVSLALGTPGWALAVDALTFALSAAFLLRLRAPGLRTDRESAFVSELRHGWKEFSSRTWIWIIVLSAAVTNAIYFPAFQVLGPTVARDSLGGSSAWALIAAAFGVGAVAGGVLALSIRPRRPLLVGEGSLLVFALPIALLAGPSPLLVIALGALLAGVAVSLEIFYETMAAQYIPREALSRVSAYDWFGSLALEPIGLALVGPVAMGLGVSPTLWAAAAVLAICQTAVILVPSVRRLEARPQGQEGGAAPLIPPYEPGD